MAPSIVSAISGWISARLTGAKLWLHVQDFEIEAAFAIGALDAHSRLGRIALSFESWVLGRFDMVSSISKPMLAKLSEKGVSSDKIYEFRNWADLSRVTVVEGLSPMRAELGITTKFIAYYSGNISSKQGLEIIPAAARILKDRTDLTFLICGEGPYLEKLKSDAMGLNNIRFLPLQPLEKLSDALGMADLHLLPQLGGMSELVLPSKLTNILASGRPVVATADPDSALAQEILGNGVVTPPEDPEAFAAAISELLDSPEKRDEYGRSARMSAHKFWDMNNVINGLEGALCGLISRSEDVKSNDLSQ